ncbi:hypothetical protein RB195_026243 [Necator americanus]|uniref:Peptidase, S9A/B/C family, catalytic domain protein n=1 Tax=Necator americanus TaxID=51031 RepID=A0ABR1EW11_NECAM
MDKNNTSNDRGRSRKLVRLLIAAFFVATIILIVVSITLLLTQEPVNLNGSATPTSSDGNETTSRLQFRRRPSYRKFTFEDLFSGKVFLKDSYTTGWTRNGGLIQTKDEYLGGTTVATVIHPGTFNAVDYLSDSSLMHSLSSNNKYAFVTKNIKQIFRHSNEELYEIRRMMNGTPSEQTFAVGPQGNGFEPALAFTWNPNPNRNDFVFVHEYNIYYQMDPEKLGSAKQLTKDGSYLLRYGVPDWLYEEEILSSGTAIWWSDSGQYLAYIRFDDRSVNRIYIPKYIRGSQYPQYTEIPYPKAGVEENPLVRLYIWKVGTNKTVIAEPPAELTKGNQSYYIFSNAWIKIPTEISQSLGHERLVTVWATREQNVIYITLCNENDCVLTHVQSFTINGSSMWAEPADFKNVFASRSGFFLILPRAYNDGNVYNHIAHMQILKNGSGRITAWHGGAYDIREIKGYDVTSDVLTFTSVGGGLGTMHLYRVSKAISTNRSSIVAISSFVPDCDYSAHEVSPDGKRAVISCIKPFQNTKMYLMDVEKPSNNKLLEGAEDAIIPFDLPELSYEIVKLPSGYEVHIGMMKPPKFDPNLKYPLLIDVYGGPNSCKVRRATPNPNMIHFCSTLGAIVVWIDGRGASNRGWNLKAPVYKALGQFETIDTIDAVKYLTSKYPFIDNEQVAVFGWSYGGFLSTHIAMRDQGETFKCAVAVAPVVDFMLYDSAYTERYLGIPFENPAGYNASQLLSKVGLLKNVNYMLAHGEADDNVHFQNSALLAEMLQAELVHFKQLVYSNQDHSMGSRQAHLFMEIGRFLSEECFIED